MRVRQAAALISDSEISALGDSSLLRCDFEALVEGLPTFLSNVHLLFSRVR